MEDPLCSRYHAGHWGYHDKEINAPKSSKNFQGVGNKSN